MTKHEFVDAVADKAGLSKKDAGAAVDAMLDVITGALMAGDTVAFTGLREVPRHEARCAPGREPPDG